MNANNRYIITGGGGSGKTTLINALRNSGFYCYHEVSRELIIEQQTTGGNLVPWGNLEGFGMECQKRMTKLLETPCYSPTFFDRGIPDILAYFAANEKKPSSIYLHHLNRYQNTVFICPPWSEIFINDAQRPESFEYSTTIFKQLAHIYTNLGFEVITIPKKEVKLRVAFIKQEIERIECFQKAIYAEL